MIGEKSDKTLENILIKISDHDYANDADDYSNNICTKVNNQKSDIINKNGEINSDLAIEIKSDLTTLPKTSEINKTHNNSDLEISVKFHRVHKQSEKSFENKLPELIRDTWNKKADFLLSVIGFAVDLANVWRFPYLCYKNGGGAFLIPYGLMLMFGGIPLFYMELALGQYIRKGAITSWGRICPLLKGVGYCVVFVAFYTDWFYNMIIAWSLYYLGVSFSPNLPWMYCGNIWNTPTCTDLHLLENGYNMTNMTNMASNRTFPVEEFFSNRVLGRTKDTNVENIGQLQWPVLLCFISVMVICYFSLWKGIHTSGKVVWFTALFPYVVLVILLFRGVTLPGSSNGIQHYIMPNITKLQTAEPWIDAATQVFFSLGPGFGVLMAYASYNKFHNNVYRDALLVATINSLTSLLSGFVVFSLLGYMAFKRGVLVLDVIQDDPVLVFSVYPEALSTLPGSVFWSICFFLMLLTLGLDSSFGGSEAVITALSDEYPIIARNREIFVLCLFTFYIGIGAIESTQSGIYWFHLFERTTVEYSILVAVFFETVCIAWIYGIDRFRSNIKEMLGFEPGLFWKICWKFIAPLFIMFNIVYGLSSYQNLQLGDYVYPLWANLLGWFFCCSSILAIPTTAIYQILRTKGTFIERIRKLTTPSDLLLIHSSDQVTHQSKIPHSYSDSLFKTNKSQMESHTVQTANSIPNCACISPLSSKKHNNLELIRTL